MTEASIPFVGGVEATVSAETSHNWGYGEENSKTSTFTASSPINVPPGKVYQGTATIKQTLMNIPYTGTVHFEGTTVTKAVSGIY